MANVGKYLANIWRRAEIIEELKIEENKTDGWYITEVQKYIYKFVECCVSTANVNEVITVLAIFCGTFNYHASPQAD